MISSECAGSWKLRPQLVDSSECPLEATHAGPLAGAWLSPYCAGHRCCRRRVIIDGSDGDLRRFRRSLWMRSAALPMMNAQTNPAIGNACYR